MADLKINFTLEKIDDSSLSIIIHQQNSLFLKTNKVGSFEYYSEKHDYSIESINSVRFYNERLCLIGDDGFMKNKSFMKFKLKLELDTYVIKLIQVLFEWAHTAPEFVNSPGSKYGLDYYLLAWEMGETEFEF